MRVLAVLAALWLVPVPARAQLRPADVSTASGGVVQGTVTTQAGTIPLGGVLVSLVTDRTAGAVSALSEASGTFRFEGLRAGEYRLTATLEGFERGARTVTVEWNRTTDVTFDLRVAASETITVVAPETAVPPSGTLTSSETLDSREIEELTPGGLQAALRLLVSVIEVPGGLAIKGGRPSQATVQLGAGTFVDPATGLNQVRLPDDAIEQVTVLPNPYAVEYGRFSSGLVLIQTRRAGDRWRTRLNNLDPSFRTKRHEPFNVEGLLAFAPRLETGGPIIRDRLFLQQSAQYRYRASDVPSRPPEDLRRSHAFGSFTRLDVTLAPRHTLIGAGGFFPSISKFATLGTFTPPDASANLESGVTTIAVTERALWSDNIVAETTFDVTSYRTDVVPQGRQAMILLPETTRGNFFNRHHRSTAAYQLIETVSGSHVGASGLHLFKAGIDLVHNRVESTSVARPVLVHRSDGTLSRRIDFGPPTSQRLDSTDLALFAQDRWQPTNRWYAEFGARLDRDGVIGRWNVTPRLGSALLLNPSGTAVVRSGIGLFFERTPSAAGVFDDYEGRVDTRYAADGVTPRGPSTPFRNVAAPDLRTARSLTWDIGYDHRFSSRWAVRIAAIDRHGSRELVLERVLDEVDSQLRLSSSGRSRYREVEFGVHFTAGERLDLNASYVRAAASADLNAFTNFFDAVQFPVVGDNQYAPARTEVPHRLLIRGRAMPGSRWLLVSILDWRSGLPYSVVDEELEFVGSRNSRRFPEYVRLELGLEHRFRLLRFEPWIGLRVDNALNAFLPTDVQSNIGSPLFGTFYNSEFRQFRITVRFER